MLAGIAIVLVIGAIVTWIGAALIARAHPPRGRIIDVGGLRQHLAESGASVTQDAREQTRKYLPIVLIHGAGCNLEDMRLALGERLRGRRLIFIDRSGHGWSERRGVDGSSPAYQATMIRDVLDQLGVSRAILVGHSWGGTLALRFALDYPQRVSGLVILAPPLYPFPRRLTWFYDVMAVRFLGPLIAHTLLLPVGTLFIGFGFCGAFFPQWPPRHYLKRAGTLMSLRPKTFLANSRDIAHLQKNLPSQVARYMTLEVPAVVMTGDRDLIVARDRHALAFAQAVPAAKLVVLPGIGHMLHHAAAEQVVAEIATLENSA